MLFASDMAEVEIPAPGDLPSQLCGVAGWEGQPPRLVTSADPSDSDDALVLHLCCMHY